MTVDVEALHEEYVERSAIIEAAGAKRDAANKSAWRILLNKHGAEAMHALRDHLTYKPLREAHGITRGTEVRCSEYDGEARSTDPPVEG